MIAFIGLHLMWLLLLEAILLFIFVANEKNFASALSIIVFLLVVHFMAGVNILNFVESYWLKILYSATAYISLGVSWGLAKWYFFVRNKKTAYLAWRASSPLHNGIHSSFGESIPPKANENKDRIVGWISFWPWSILWTLLDDFLTKIFREVYELFSKTFQRISDSQFKGIPTDKN